MQCIWTDVALRDTLACPLRSSMAWLLSERTSKKERKSLKKHFLNIKIHILFLRKYTHIYGTKCGCFSALAIIIIVFSPPLELWSWSEMFYMRHTTTRSLAKERSRNWMLKTIIIRSTSSSFWATGCCWSKIMRALSMHVLLRARHSCTNELKTLEKERSWRSRAWKSNLTIVLLSLSPYLQFAWYLWYRNNIPKRSSPPPQSSRLILIINHGMF